MLTEDKITTTESNGGAKAEEDEVHEPSIEMPPPVPPCQYEYLDHTADVQLHAWGNTEQEALEQLIVSLYGYMTTQIDRVELIYSMDFTASGHDLSALVYNLLDTCLYNFAVEPFFIGRTAKVLNLNRPSTEGQEITIHVRVWGESFDPEKHPPGTEIKAITYSNMQIINDGEKDSDQDQHQSKRSKRDNEQQKTDIFVIVDI